MQLFRLRLSGLDGAPEPQRVTNCMKTSVATLSLIEFFMEADGFLPMITIILLFAFQLTHISRISHYSLLDPRL